ncbi:MAG: ABC transporter permease, partial [Pararhodobacter sp.]|nr:ABC transporter permease [Pararhodobacter sp.]
MTRPFRTMPLTALFGIVVILAYALVAIFAPWIAPYPETAIVGSEYLPWSEEFLLGTDSLGRDMLSRLIYGARNTLGIALATTVIA